MWADSGFKRSEDASPSILFTASFLSSNVNLEIRDRLSILACVKSFDIDSPRDARGAILAAAKEAGIAKRFPLTTNALQDAVETVKKWLSKNVFVMKRQDLNFPGRNLEELPELVFCSGNVSIANKKAAAILNSRKPRLIKPNDYWIIATKRLAAYAYGNNLAVVSSFGNIPYALVNRLFLGHPTLIVCDKILPHMLPEEKQMDVFSELSGLFDPEKTLFISPFPPGRMPNSAQRAHQRDRLVAALASVWLVAEVRPGGNMDKIITSGHKRSVEILRDHQVPAIERESLNDKNKKKPDHKGSKRYSSFETFEQISSKDYLFHYTRSCPGPWPGQTIGEYCQSLIDDHQDAEHTGFDTLCRILQERLIRAGRRLIRKNRPVVSFTECKPSEMSKLIKWRRGLIRWSFEPYGIALPKDDLFKIGARPVIYGTKKAFADLTDDLRYLFQLSESARETWYVEKEWRILCDLTLNASLRKQMVIIVASSEEAEKVVNRFGYTVALAGI